jgi:hypothetical protein
MILIKPDFIQEVQSAKTKEDIQNYLSGAVTLELATLPTYFTGIFSIKPGTGSTAKTLAQSVALEEMLHLTLASNLLIAVGGNPNVYRIGASLKFPTQLPLGVIPDLTIPLTKMSKEQVYSTYMGIECPDTASILPGETQLHPVAALRKEAEERGVDYRSIGDFYDVILQKLDEIPAVLDTPRAENQVDISKWFPPAIPANPTGKVIDLNTATEVIKAIIREGEGAQVGSDPINPKGGLNNTYAHYFKFAEIYYGKELVQDENGPSGWSYSGADIPFSEEFIYNFRPNTALSDITKGSAAYNDASEFYGTYLRLLRAVHNTFNGQPEELKTAFGIMYELKLAAAKVVRHPFDPNDPSGYVCPPPFMAT